MGIESCPRAALCCGDGAEATSKQGVDIVMNSRLAEYTMNKKDYMAYIK